MTDATQVGTSATEDVSRRHAIQAGEREKPWGAWPAVGW